MIVNETIVIFLLIYSLQDDVNNKIMKKGQPPADFLILEKFNNSSLNENSLTVFGSKWKKVLYIVLMGI